MRALVMCKLSQLNALSGTLAIIAATSLGACSADISRLDSSMLGVSGERTGTVRPTTGKSAALGDSGDGWGDSGRSSRQSFPAGPPSPPSQSTAASADRRFAPPPYQAPYSSPTTSGRYAAVTPPATPSTSPSNTNRYAPVTAAPPQDARPADRAPSLERSAPRVGRAPVGDGRSITVQKGDTLFGLSRRHNVSVADLKSANGLTSSALKLGQELVLPGAGGAPRQGGGTVQPVGMTGDGAPRLEPRAEATPSDDSGDGYVVKRGDSLYKIARANGMTLAELQRINAISDPKKVMPGTVLKLKGDPGGSTIRGRVATVKTVTTTRTAMVDRDGDRGAPTRTDSSPEPSETRPETVASRPAAAPIAGGNQPRILNSGNSGREQADSPPATETRVANITTAPAASAAQSATTNPGKFRWPATGRILSAYGPRPDGSHNDGINILVPLGTPVHASEAGTVAYAGNELQGYGNLVLVRHDNGWVSAYAHNDALLVRHGDRVTRGQVIAKAGKSGSVDQPQIHFELRDGARPVDPRPHLAKL